METGEKSLIAADDRADIGGTWRDPDTGEPYVYAVTYDKTQYFAMDERGEEILAALDNQFEGEVSRASTTQDGSKWVVVNTQSDKVATYYVWDRTEDSFTEPLFCSS